MINIFTENLFFLPSLKNFVKSLAGKVHRGPKAVQNSLLLGLKELGVSFVLDKTDKNMEIACVLSGVKTLAWAIEQKRRGAIKKILAGPNLVIDPKDHGGIICNEIIDKVIVPSDWVKEFYMKSVPRIKDKLYIWPAGVSLPEIFTESKKYDFLVLNKISGTLPKQIADYFTSQNYRLKIANYGHFNQHEYFALLRQSKRLVYLSESESQGLAMFEAWAHNVPTFVWDRGFMEYGRLKFYGKTGAPYLTAETGLSFSDFETFKQKLPEFLNGQFLPREWVRRNATHKIAAQNYLKLIQI